MSKKLEGHQRCEICHPDLNPRWYKSGNGHGVKCLKPQDRRNTQDNIIDLLKELDEAI